MFFTLLYVNAINRLAIRSAAATHDDEGQATAEYALVLLGAAAIALLVVTWASKTGLVGKLLDAVLDNLLGKAKG